MVRTVIDSLMIPASNTSLRQMKNATGYNAMSGKSGHRGSFMSHLLVRLTEKKSETAIASVTTQVAQQDARSVMIVL